MTYIKKDDHGKVREEKERDWEQWWGSETGPEYQCSMSKRIQGCSAPKTGNLGNRAEEHHNRLELEVSVPHSQ